MGTFRLRSVIQNSQGAVTTEQAEHEYDTERRLRFPQLYLRS